MFCLKLCKYEHFYRLEVVGGGSDTQLQVCKNISNLSYKYII